MAIAFVPDEKVTQAPARNLKLVPERGVMKVALAPKKRGILARIFGSKKGEAKVREIRAYQERLVSSVIGAFAKHKTVLLAACPNAGKTFMAGEIIGRTVDRARSKKQILVLAHGTNVLRIQFEKDLEENRPDLVPFTDVRIPQAIYQKDIAKYDLVIVDEAHQFYGKGERGDGKNQKMMKTILGKAKPKNVLLLTGSPAKFIADGKKAGEDMFCFSLEQLHNEQPDAVADVMVECASSHYKIKDEDYADTFGEVRRDFDGYSQRATVATLDDVLEIVIKRLKLSGDKLDTVLGKARFDRTKAGWDFAFGRIGKTVLAVPSIKVADQAGAYFEKKGISCLVSHSEDDVESEHIERFKAEEGVRLLIVVNRGQLGFDYRELFHFIDMTGSKSPDRIFQMLCRVVRSSIESPNRNKLFIKVMPRIFSEVQVRAFMSGVLSLAQQANFEKWNGKGLSLQDVPVGRGERPPRCPKRDKHKRGTKCPICKFYTCRSLHVVGVECPECGKTKPQPVPVLESGMRVFGDYFKALEHNPDDPFCPYAMAKLGEVLGEVVHDSAGKKAAILEFFRANSRWPNKRSKDHKECQLGTALSKYAFSDASFKAQIEALGWVALDSHIANTKQNILEFFQLHSHWPNKRSPDEVERRLAVAFGHYTTPSKSPDPAFIEQVRGLGWRPLAERSGANQDRILAFYSAQRRWPTGASKDATERGLGHLLSHYTNPNGPRYDPGFVGRIGTLGWVPIAERVKKGQEEIKAFFITHGRWPRAKAPDDEGRLGALMSNYVRAHGQRGRESHKEFVAEITRMGWIPSARSEGVKGKKASIIAYFRSNGKWPRGGNGAASEEERALGQLLSLSVSKNSRRYDAEFRAQIEAIGWIDRSTATAAYQDEVFTFFEKTGHWPSGNSEDVKERRLYERLGHYSRTDEAFRGRAEEAGWRPRAYGCEQTKADILRFFRAHRRWPRKLKDPQEKRLGASLSRYTATSTNSFDAAFRAKCAKLDPKRFGGK